MTCCKPTFSVANSTSLVFPFNILMRISKTKTFYWLNNVFLFKNFVGSKGNNKTLEFGAWPEERKTELSFVY